MGAAAASFAFSALSSATRSHRNSNHLSLASSYSLHPNINLRSRLHHRHSLKTSTPTKITATISVRDKLPESTLSYFESDGKLQTTTISDLTKSKKSIFFAVPGAFTPTCSQKHLPGFVEKSSELKAKGVNTITCISVNKAFVMKAWKADLEIGDEVLLLRDENGDFTKAIGCKFDPSDNAIGLS